MPDTAMTSTMPSETAMRRAVAERDARRDGEFVYAVVTTGVYCRPSCASRPARPENLRFFATPAAAAGAGVRAGAAGGAAAGELPGGRRARRGLFAGRDGAPAGPREAGC